MNTIDEMIEVLQGYKEGKKMQYLDKYGNWRDIRTTSWEFNDYKYRIKPEEKKKVKMWQFYFKCKDNLIASTHYFYKSAEDAQGNSNTFKILGPIPNTEIEVEE